jgi:hypothetical protein
MLQLPTANYLVTIISQLSGWRPLHTNLLVFSSQADFQLSTDWIKVKVKVSLRLAVYRQSVRLGVKPLETHDQRFFSNELR